MKSLGFLLCVGLFSFACAHSTPLHNGYVTKVKGISKEDVEKRREEISDILIRSSETLDLDSENTVNVLYKDSLVVHHRNYTFAVSEAESQEECAFGPIIKDHRQVYYHVRDLTPDENAVYAPIFKEATNENAESRSTHAKKIGGRDDDIIVPTFQIDNEGTFVLDEQGEKMQDWEKFALVRPVRFVKYHCQTGTFCCENRCCPSAIKNYLKKVKQEGKDTTMQVQIDSANSTTLHVKPDALNGTANRRACGYVIEQENFFGWIADSDVDAVR